MLTPEQQAWVADYEREEERMSRSNPTEGARNPSTRWFEWAGGSDGGFVRWYNKDTEQQIKVDGAFTFLLLDELSTIKGWHEASESSIYSNEVRDTRQETLVVKSFKGGELASGIYTSIRDRIVAIGGHYCASIYLAYKAEDGTLKIGNLNLKGAAAGAWMEFKRNAPTKKDAAGKSARAYFVDAVKISGFEEAKKGGTTYRVPTFALTSTTDATNQQALALDAELQAFLADYFKRPKAEAAKAAEPPAEPATTTARDEPPARKGRFDDMEDDIPFSPIRKLEASVI